MFDHPFLTSFITCLHVLLYFDIQVSFLVRSPLPPTTIIQRRRRTRRISGDCTIQITDLYDLLYFTEEHWCPFWGMRKRT